MKYGFSDVVMERYPETVYWLYNVTFSAMPLIGILNNQVIGLHGGVASNTKYLKDIENLPTNQMSGKDERLGNLWNDPKEDHEGFEENKKRKIFFTFGKDVFDEFMQNNGLSLMVRGHEEIEEGARYFFDRQLISVFSSKGNEKVVEPKVVLVGDGDGGVVEILGL